MTPKRDIVYRCLAAACAALIGYVGLLHEVVGTRFFPEGLEKPGGWVGWHAVGIVVMALGAGLFAGVVGVPRVPVVPLASLVAVGGALITVDAAITYGRFHFFAVTLVMAGLGLIALGRRIRLPDGPAGGPNL